MSLPPSVGIRRKLFKDELKIRSRVNILGASDESTSETFNLTFSTAHESNWTIHIVVNAVFFQREFGIRAGLPVFS